MTPAADGVPVRSLRQLLSSRRMCRDFQDRDVDPDVLGAILAASQRGPAAGNAAVPELLVLEGEDTERYWSTTFTRERRDSFAWPGLFRAPVLIVPYVDPSRYTDRYSEADKAHTGLGGSQDAWSVPYWWVDGGAAVMAMLLAATDADLGALLFGQFGHEPAVKEAFGVPAHLRALGTIALGHRAVDEVSESRSARRPRPSLDEVVHRGCW